MRGSSMNALFLALSTASPMPATPAEIDVNDFNTAQAVFEESLAGDSDKTDLALERFDALVNADLSHPLLLAYLGSAYTLKARDGWMPWTKLRNVETGLEKIDKALLMLRPQHDEQHLRGSIISSETRLVAISTYLQVPESLNRLQDAKDVLAQALESPVYEASAPEVKGRIQLWAAEVAKREDNSESRRAHLEQAMALLPPGRYAELARTKLAEVEN